MYDLQSQNKQRKNKIKINKNKHRSKRKRKYLPFYRAVEFKPYGQTPSISLQHPQSAAAVGYAKGLGKLSAKWQSFDPNIKKVKKNADILIGTYYRITISILLSLFSCLGLIQNASSQLCFGYFGEFFVSVQIAGSTFVYGQLRPKN